MLVKKKCSKRIIEEKLIVLLGNYDRQTNRSSDGLIDMFHFQRGQKSALRRRGGKRPLKGCFASKGAKFEGLTSSRLKCKGGQINRVTLVLDF